MDPNLPFVVLFAGVVLSLLWLYVRLGSYWQQRRDMSHVTYEIFFPRSLDHGAANQLRTALQAVLEQQGTSVIFGGAGMAFETLIEGDQVRYFITFEPGYRDAILGVFEVIMPAADLEPATGLFPAQRSGSHVQWRRAFRLYGLFDTKAKSADVEVVQRSFRGLQDERVVLRWLLHPFGRYDHDDRNRPIWEFPRRDYLFSGDLTIAWDGPQPSQAVKRITSAISMVGGKHQLQEIDPALASTVDTQSFTIFGGRQSPIGEAGAVGDELPVYMGWPINNVRVSGLNFTRAGLMTNRTIADKGWPVARVTRHGKTRTLAIGAEDALKHTSIIGKTQTGKSTLMLNLTTAQINEGHGVGVIDPHGDLVEDILERVPKHRVKDVVLFEPAVTSWAVGFNIFAGTDAPEVLADQIMSIFHGIYRDSGIYTSNYLRGAIQALAAVPGMTLVDVPAFLTDQRFRGQIVKKLVDPILRRIWEDFDAKPERERNQLVLPAIHRIQPLLMRESVRRALGQSDNKLDMARVIRERKILLVSIPKSMGEETSNLFGSLFFARIWQAAQGIPRAERVPFFLSVDEAQNFLGMPMPLDVVLAEAAKFKLGLTLANQYEAQMPLSMRQALHTNCRTTVKFQLNADDARVAEKEMGPDVTADDFLQLARHQIIMQTIVDNQPSSPALGTTLPPAAPVIDPAAVRAASRRSWATVGSAVDAQILERQTASKEVRKRPRTGWDIDDV